MIKRIMVVLATAAAALALTAAPASANLPPDGQIAISKTHTVLLDTADVHETAVPATCSPVPALASPALSAANRTLQVAAFYRTKAECDANTPIAVVAPGAGVMAFPAGATFWQDPT